MTDDPRGDVSCPVQECVQSDQTGCVPGMERVRDPVRTDHPNLLAARKLGYSEDGLMVWYERDFGMQKLRRGLCENMPKARSGRIWIRISGAAAFDGR